MKNLEKREKGTGHGGNIHLYSRNSNNDQAQIIDFSANINPLGPPDWTRKVITSQIEKIVHYPDPDSVELINAIAKHHNIADELIVAANGTTELLYLIPRITQCKRAIIPVPSYIDYLKVMELNSVECVKFFLRPEDDFELNIEALRVLLQPNDIVILGSPNNPTATFLPSQTILDLAAEFAQTVFLIDEAFIDFLENTPSVAGKRENIITLNSLTKFYAIPGLRLGYGVFPRAYAERMRTFLPPWTINSLAQSVGSQLFKDSEYRLQTLSYTKELRRVLHEKLSCFSNLKVYHSDVNYFLIKILAGPDASELSEKLLKDNIAIRVCDNYEGLDSTYFRVAVRTQEENDQLIRSLDRVLNKKIQRKKKQAAKKNKSLMIQGTSSNAGKSVIVAALCRILIQDGVGVVPFKAQNMSLNSYVTRNGLEMGRAQVVQAQAAKIDPDVRMNPVLLKPNSDVGCQVVVNGLPVGNMSVQHYLKYKEKAGKAACAGFDELASEYEVVILEGAGSPGEINLKKNDIVNMQMARHAKSPVLLVGDIDRGGVYASFVGTMEVLFEWERKLVQGFLVNRFRGDATLLQSAHDYIFEHTGKNVMGIIPYITNLGIPEEDSVSFKEGQLQRPRPQSEYVEIALINLPHISNFTDIEPFLDEPDVYFNIVNSVEELGNPHAIILPGSKNVIGDLNYLNNSGLAQAIIAKANDGVEIVGICGGYQILGKTINDPYSIESEQKHIPALSLLNLETTLAIEKTLTRKTGKHSISGLNIHGYEIHHGISTHHSRPALIYDDGSVCGCHATENTIWGSYLHGVFDGDEFRRWFINQLRIKEGMASIDTIVAPYNLELAFDNLANIVRESIQMDKIYKILGI